MLYGHSHATDTCLFGFSDTDCPQDGMVLSGDSRVFAVRDVGFTSLGLMN